MNHRTPQLRRTAIESLIRDRTEVDIPSLAVHFGVSEMTIRRDLEALESEGVVRRLMGGRAVIDSKSREPTLSVRADTEHDTKAHIGRAVAELIDPDEVVYFDGGTTVLAVARALRGSAKPLTVLTRSVPVMLELAQEPDVEIFVLGGRLKPSEMVTTSTNAADDLHEYNVDTYVMGTSGVHPTRGLTDYNPDERAGKRLALERSDRVLLAVDHSKLGRVLMSRVADIESIDILVTDAEPDDETITALPSTVTVILVDPAPKPA